jgi:hypothetical protein
METGKQHPGSLIDPGIFIWNDKWLFNVVNGARSASLPLHKGAFAPFGAGKQQFIL